MFKKKWNAFINDLMIIFLLIVHLYKCSMCISMWGINRKKWSVALLNIIWNVLT